MPQATTTNTRTSLWPDRWPAIALQECIDKVEAAPVDQQAEVKWNLPCVDCPKNQACLNAKRKELGTLIYGREINTNPRSSESSLFPYEMFVPMLLDDESFVPYYNKPYSIESRYGVCSAWDLAWSEKSGGDYLVKMTGLIDRQTGKKRILDIGRWQRISFDDQIQLMGSEWAMFKDDLVVIESDAAQTIWYQHLERNSSVPVMPHNASQKKDFASGVPKLLIELEQQKWQFPYERGSHHHENMEIFLAEAEAFGWVDDKLEGVGEHDDTVMCWWHLSWGLDKLVVQSQQLSRNVRPGAEI